MVLTSDDALTQLSIFAGLVIGIAIATIKPYLDAKTKYQEFDINILFKKEFLGVAAGAFIAAFVTVSGSFNALFAQILAGNPASYLAAFIAALGTGFFYNTVGNWLTPKTTNPEAKAKMHEAIAAKVLADKGIDLERLSNMNVTFENGAIGKEDFDKKGDIDK